MSHTAPSMQQLNDTLAEERATLKTHEPGAWEKVTLPAAVEKGVAEPEVRLVSSAAGQVGSKIVELRGAVKVKAGKTVKTTETLFTVPAGFRPTVTRITGVLSVTLTTGVVKPTAEQTENTETSLVGLVYVL